MGDPRRLKKNYNKPAKMFSAPRIESENALVKEFGLKNKKELWKINKTLKDFQIQAKGLVAIKTDQAEKERKQLMDRLQFLGIIDKTADLNHVLSLSAKDFLERRLQTIVYKKYARSLSQARQFITHEHIAVGDKKITIPSYLVPISEEAQINFTEESSFKDEAHPERKQPEKEVVPDQTAEKAKDAPKKEAPKEEKPVEAKKESTEEKPKSEEKKQDPKTEEKPDKKEESPKEEKVPTADELAKKKEEKKDDSTTK